MIRGLRLACLLALVSVPLSLFGCRSEGPEVGSQTNWLKACETSSDCAELECICGTCTIACISDEGCGDYPSSSCVPTSDDGSIALCGGTIPNDSLCLQRCDDEDCPSGSQCVAGVCSPALDPSIRVSIDPEQTAQPLIGIGASISYDGDFIVQHPEKQAIFDALFTEAGLDMIRVRSRFDDDDPAALLAASEIVAEAAARRPVPPVVLLSSSSPPPALKANGVRFCGQLDPDCTLARDAGGNFDYAAFGDYWSAALQAYEAVGVTPDYISIQNNPDWLPAFPEGGEACRFLPREGTTSVTLADGTTVNAEFPGYDAALDAVRTAIEPLGGDYTLVAPESERIGTVGDFTDALDPSSYGAIGYHLFAVDPENPPIDELEGIREASEDAGLPHMQTEMGADAIGTAILIHHTLITAGGGAYLQQQMVSPVFDSEGGAPIGADDQAFEVQPALHALAHFAKNTEPGWVNVLATGDSDDLLTSAWLAPSEDELTIVLVNPSDEDQAAELEVPAEWLDALPIATVMRSVFRGVELSANLGELSASRVVRVPARSVVTVVVSR